MKNIPLPSIPWEKLSGLTRVHKIMICVGTFILLGAGYYFLLYTPKADTIARLEEDYENVQRQLRTVKNKARNINKFREEHKRFKTQFRMALLILPDKKEIPSLLENVSGSGKEAGLEFILFKPEAEIARDFYVEIPVAIKVVGSYHNTAIFFDKVSKLSRLVNIADIEIKAETGKGSPGLLHTTCTAITYQFRETPKPVSQKGKKR
nr:protein PilO [Desulfobacterales bacterium]